MKNRASQGLDIALNVDKIIEPKGICRNFKGLFCSDRREGEAEGLKLIYVVIDGMSDLPVEELGGWTPLEFAETRNMDFLASRGRLGLMYTVGKGIAPESDVAVVSILGYDPYKYHVGRGVFEAYGVGLEMKDGDLALRCNFATLDKDKKILDRRAGRNLTAEEASELAEAINREVKLKSYPVDFEFRNTVGHRGVLVLKSKMGPLSGKITNTDPAYERIKGLGVAKAEFEMVLDECRPLEDTEAAKVSARLVNEFVEESYTILDGHEVNRRREAEGELKANVVLTRDAGDKLPKFFSINKRYGVRFVCLADMPVERGISKLTGMRVVELPPPSGDLKADCVLRAKKLLDLLLSFDCFYIHLKGPDESGHDGDFKLKAQTIAVIDEFFLGNLLSQIDLEDYLICVTADHSTPCKLKTHSDNPVPLLIAGDEIESDDIRKFSEKECRNGSLGTLEKGTELMPMLMRLLKKGE